jgi:hypothetical protein
MAILLAWPAGLAGQHNEPPAPAAYALQGVTVVSPDGVQRPGMTVVVRGGLIEAIGPNVAAPPDAEVLEGDSLFLYPGLVDAAGKAEYKFPEIEVDQSQVGSWNPPRSVQSFMPHRRVVDNLVATGKDLADQRRAGVVAAAVHADGRLMPGRGTVLLMRLDAETSTELVLVPTLGPAMSLQGAQSVYPQRLFAVIAFYRQAFEDARHLAAHQRAYERGRNGVSAPQWDPDLDVLQEAMSGDTPVFFSADLGRDIQRVLMLSEEYGFSPIIVGGEEAWKAADELKARNTPVLISLDFPEPERWKPEEKKSEEEPGAANGAGMNGSQEEEELDAAAQREKQRLEDIYANAGRLAEAGVQFALTSGGGEADILEGTRKAIEYGLSEEAALAALTTSPAALLGIERVVRVQVGGPATFVASDGPLFGEDAKVVYTFVEGGLEKPAKKGGATEEATVDVTGTWEITTVSEIGTNTHRASFTQNGSDLEGSMSSRFGEGPISNGLVSGNEISFEIVRTIQDNRLRIEYTGTVEGDEITGEGTTRMGGFTWTAKKIGGPNGR